MTSSSYRYDLDVDREARKQLDDEINQLEERIVELKRARNALAPVTRLHPEILQEIFFLAHYSSEHKGKATLLISWVSHKWRQLAHDTSTLWSQIDFKNSDWIQLALSRAKNRELEISLNGLKRIKNNLVPLIPYTLAHLSRIRKLKITSDMGKKTRAIPEDTPEWLFPAPRLVDLDLRGLILPPNLFSGIIPCLQSLRLTLCRFDWERLPITRGMKKLSLHSAPINATATLDNMINIFRTIGPDLEELELEDVLHPNSEALPSAGHDRLRFEKLRVLKLEDSQPGSIARLFDYVALPNRVNIEIVAPEWTESNLVPSLISARNMKRWPIECLKIKVEGGGVELGLFEEWFEPTASNEPDDTRAQTHVKLDISALEEPSRFLAAVELLPIKPIEKVFFIGGSHECQDPMIVEYIGKLGTVQELSIDVPSLPTFFMSTSEQVDQLQRLIEGEDIGEVGSTLSAEKIALGQGLVLFHGLRDLTIYGELDGETLTREAAIILQTWLEWRKRFNLQLDQLFISGVSTPPGAWLAGLFDGLVGDFQTKNLT